MVSGRTADRDHIPRRRRIGVLVQPPLCTVGADEQDRRIAGRTDVRRARGADDDRRPIAGDGARGGSGRPRLVRIETEQQPQAQRIRQNGDRRTGRRDLDGRQGSERKLAGVGDLVDDR